MTDLVGLGLALVGFVLVSAARSTVRHSIPPFRLQPGSPDRVESDRFLIGILPEPCLAERLRSRPL